MKQHNDNELKSLRTNGKKQHINITLIKMTTNNANISKRHSLNQLLT